MYLLFEIFVLPPLVIAGVVLIATWNLCGAVIAFRVAFFACPICGLFVLSDRGPEGIALLLLRSCSRSFWSRVMRLPSGVDYMPPSTPAASSGRYQLPFPSPQNPPPVPVPSETLYSQLFAPTPPTPSAVGRKNMIRSVWG